MKNNLDEFCEETQNWRKTYFNSNQVYPVMDLDERIRIIEKRLLIVEPPEDTLSKYPALAEAYNQYKLIEKLTLANDKET
jgi:hypothetical protein